MTPRRRRDAPLLLLASFARSRSRCKKPACCNLALLSSVIVRRGETSDRYVVGSLDEVQRSLYIYIYVYVRDQFSTMYDGVYGRLHFTSMSRLLVVANKYREIIPRVPE